MLINYTIQCFISNKILYTFPALTSQIARFMRPTWGPPGSRRPQMGHMLAPWTLLSVIGDATSSSISYSMYLLSYHDTEINCNGVALWRSKPSIEWLFRHHTPSMEASGRGAMCTQTMEVPLPVRLKKWMPNDKLQKNWINHILVRKSPEDMLLSNIKSDSYDGWFIPVWWSCFQITCSVMHFWKTYFLPA